MRYLLIGSLFCILSLTQLPGEIQKEVPITPLFNYALFKDLKSIAVIASPSLHSKEMNAKYIQIFEEELKNAGTVTKTYLYDPKGFPIANADASLGFNVNSLVGIHQKALSVIECSLSLMMEVSSLKSKITASHVSIWTDSSFLGETQMNNDLDIRLAIQRLVKELSETYITANGKEAPSPNFYLYYW